MGERQKCIVGVHEFLRSCREPRPAVITSALLDTVGIEMDTHNISKLVRRYDKALNVGQNGVWIPRDKLPLFWIGKIIDCLMYRAERLGQTPKKPIRLETWVETQLEL